MLPQIIYSQQDYTEIQKALQKELYSRFWEQIG